MLPGPIVLCAHYCSLITRHKFRQAGWESVGILPEDGSQSPTRCLESKKCTLSACLAKNGCLQLIFLNLTVEFRPKWMKSLVPRETSAMRILANWSTYHRYCGSEVRYQSELFGSAPAMSCDCQEELHTFKNLGATPRCWRYLSSESKRAGREPSAAAQPCWEGCS